MDKVERNGLYCFDEETIVISYRRPVINSILTVRVLNLTI